MHQMLSQRSCREEPSKLRLASPPDNSLKTVTDGALERIEYVMNIHPLMGSNAFQNQGRQFLF